MSNPSDPIAANAAIAALDVIDVIATVRRVAADRPEHEAGCQYILPGSGYGPVKEAHCLVGVALNNLGIDLDQLSLVENSTPRSWWYNRHGSWLQNVQEAADAGRTWAAAVRSADDDLEVIGDE